MRTTVTVADELFEEAARISQQTKPSRVIEASLKEYVAKENAAKIANGYIQSLDRDSLISPDEMSQRIDALLARKREQQ